MSSIISDLFYGSKQNILDNYLINRHQNNQQSSAQQKQQTVLYTSFIEFVIRLPHAYGVQKQQLLKIAVEMGNRSDEGFIEIKDQQGESSSIVLALNDLEQQDLYKYTNIKITISEGKYQNKVHGFVPIEAIKSIAESQSGEKTILVAVKGKKSLGFETIQCTIRTEFPNNNVLNSQIMKSVEKDYSSYMRSREQNISNLSQQPSSLIKNVNDHKQTVSRRYNNTRFQQPIRLPKESSNIFIEEGRPYQKHHSKPMRTEIQGAQQFVREIRAIQIKATKIHFISKTTNYEAEGIRLKINQTFHKMNEVIQICHITTNGTSIQLIYNESMIGNFHLSVLLLTLKHISGQLPIHFQQKFIGTITIESPHPENTSNANPTPISNIANLETKRLDPLDTKQLIALCIDKIIFINSFANLQDQSLQYQHQIQLFNLSKMESQNRLEVIIRVNGQIFKFTNLMLKYLSEKQLTTVAELRQKEPFMVEYFKEKGSATQLQIQIFSGYRLISYSKQSIDDKFSHKFVTGETSCKYFHCAIYVKYVRLEFMQDYFQQNKIKSIFSILQDIINRKIAVSQPNDQQIKAIMNLHKRVTFVEIKKLMALLQKNIPALHYFQQSQLKTVYSEHHQNNQPIFKLVSKLLEQFIYIDYQNKNCISKEQFENVLKFYKQECQSYYDNWEKIIKYVIECDGFIPYAFFIAGYYFQKSEQIKREANQNPAQIIQQKQNNVQKKEQSTFTKQKLFIVQPSYFIEKIILRNVHLLNLGKVPNITLNLVKKICYSNSCPEFVIEKEVSLLESIKIYNKSIVEDRLILLAQFTPSRRQTHYELQPTGKSMAKIIWGR